MVKASWLRRGDIAVAATVLITALLLFAGSLPAADGGFVQVTTPTERCELSLAGEYSRTFTGRDGIVLTLQVKDGAVWVSHADCPDLLCVQSGRLSRAGAACACVPAGITLRVLGESEVDAVVR